MKTSMYNESDGNTRFDPYAHEICGREEAVKKLPVKEEIEVIGGAVQTREGRIRETHPLKPLLIHGTLNINNARLNNSKKRKLRIRV